VVLLSRSLSVGVSLSVNTSGSPGRLRLFSLLMKGFGLKKWSALNKLITLKHFFYVISLLLQKYALSLQRI